MLRPVLAAALLLLAPGFVAAQEADAPAASQQDPQAAYNELAKSFGKAMNTWMTERQAAIKKAQETGKRPPRSAMRPPTKEFIATAQEYAAQFSGKDDAVQFLAFIIKNASTERNAVKNAVKTLALDYAKSDAIGDVLGHLANAKRFGAQKAAMALLGEVAENHGNADCKAQALVVRGGMRLQGGDLDGGAEDLRAVASLTKDEDLLAEAKEALFEVEKLAIGATAPEIEGVDVDGVDFKLSDYRGKVVLLDFWGFW